MGLRFLVEVALVCAVSAAPFKLADPFFLPLEPEKNNTQKLDLMKVEETQGSPTNQPESQEPTYKYERCVFIHGLGNKERGKPLYEIVPPNLRWPDDMVQHTKQCKDHVFLQENTVSQAWFDGNLSKAICDDSLSRDQVDRVIRNSMIFSYSMGTISLAAAIDAGECSVDKSTSSWHAIGMATAHFREEDGVNVGHFLHNDGFDATRKRLSEMGMSASFAFNEDGTYARSVACISEGPTCHNPPTVERRERVMKIVNDNVDSAICGYSAEGWKKQDVDAALFGKLWAGKELNDGFVSLKQCARVAKDGVSAFSTDPTAKFFKGALNHFELTCYHGDGPNPEEKACVWIESRR